MYIRHSILCILIPDPPPNLRLKEDQTPSSPPCPPKPTKWLVGCPRIPANMDMCESGTISVTSPYIYGVGDSPESGCSSRRTSWTMWLDCCSSYENQHYGSLSRYLWRSRKRWQQPFRVHSCVDYEASASGSVWCCGIGDVW